MKVTIAFVPVMLGIILHEVAHGWVASKCGDLTAKMLGRLTLNPIKHIDPTGTLLFIMTAIASPVIFGWAKPIPVNPRNLHNPRTDMMLLSFAGPFTNILLALTFAVCQKILLTFISLHDASATTIFFFNMFRIGVFANIALAWINLMPIPPLDGSRIVAGLLPVRMAYHYESLSRYGFVLLFILLLTGVIGKVLWPLIRVSLEFIAAFLDLDIRSIIP